jgi:hypothetical protein
VPKPMECSTETTVPMWMRGTLHDLCQPLMALECQLYLASLGVGDASEPGSSEPRAMFASGLDQCQRMIQLIRAAQMRMAKADQEASETTEGRSR